MTPSRWDYSLRRLLGWLGWGALWVLSWAGVIALVDWMIGVIG